MPKLIKCGCAFLFNLEIAPDPIASKFARKSWIETEYLLPIKIQPSLPTRSNHQTTRSRITKRQVTESIWNIFHPVHPLSNGPNLDRFDPIWLSAIFFTKRNTHLVRGEDRIDFERDSREPRAHARETRITWSKHEFFQGTGVNINSCLDFPRVCIIGYATFRHNVSTATRFREPMRALRFATFLKSGNHMSYRVESLGHVQFTLSKNAELSLQTLCIAATSPGRYKDQRHPRQLLKNVYYTEYLMVFYGERKYRRFIKYPWTLAIIDWSFDNALEVS